MTYIDALHSYASGGGVEQLGIAMAMMRVLSWGIGPEVELPPFTIEGGVSA